MLKLMSYAHDYEFVPLILTHMPGFTCYNAAPSVSCSLHFSCDSLLPARYGESVSLKRAETFLSGESVQLSAAAWAARRRQEQSRVQRPIFVVFYQQLFFVLLETIFAIYSGHDRRRDRRDRRRD